MAYEKLNLANGQKFNAAHLAHIENGIEEAFNDTPVKGVDYWTEAEQETIVQEVIAALGMPVFGTVDSDKNIILTGVLADGTYTVKYEDADGNAVMIGKIVLAGHSNFADPTSTDWKENSRINSSFAIVATSYNDSYNGALTNYIPCKAGDVIRIKGLDVAYYWANTSGDTGRSTAYFYGEDQTLSAFVDKIIPADSSYWMRDGDVWTYTVGNGLTADASAIRYARFFGRYMDDYDANSVVITINEEIT